MVESTAEVSRGTGPKLECDRVFRFIVWNWNEPTNQPQPTEIFDIADCLNKLLGAGTRVVITTTSNAPVLSYMIDSIHKTHRRRLFLATNDEGTVFGFDHRGTPVEVVHRALSGRGAALKYFIEREIRPLAVDSAQILVIDDAPSEGSAGVNTQSSVWLEECVGPSTWSRCALAQVADVLRRQTDLDARLGDFAVPRDAAWTIVESGFDMAREHEIESLLAIANGYVGVRGSIAEGSAVSRPATFLAGVFEQSSDVSPVPELVIAPDWGRLRFTIEGELFSAASTAMHHHHRTLDMRRGVLLREGIAIGDGGHATEIRTLHAASMAARHLLIEFVEIVPRNFSGTVQIDAILSGDVRSESGGVHWNRFEPRDCRQGPMLVGMTRAGFQLALTSHTNAVSGPDSIMNCRREFGPTSAMERCELHVRLGERSILHRIVGMYSSRDEGDPVIRAESLELEVARVSSMELLDEHAAAWETRWQRADIEIDGAPKIERALRFGMYHLLGAVHPTDPRTSIGARALSGQAYRGHVFWDTEIFMLPFYTHVWPEAARTLLRYRHRTLDGARRKARGQNYQGALFAWESADTGDETTPPMVLTPYGEIIPILSGIEEHHISADVAYAIWAYTRATGDDEFLADEGAEILIETARFWASRAQSKKDGSFHVERIIGPDEYHESVDDNAFTNYMAKKNLLVAAAVARQIGRPKAATLGVTPDEITEWENIAQRMYLGVDENARVIEQHKGFFQLEQVDLSAFAPRSAPMDVLLGRERIQASQVVKQADVVQLIALLWDEIDPVLRRKSFLYYEPRTAHGSSLSPGVHAWIAARLGLSDLANRYLEQTADIDLGNNMGNSAGGVHAAAMGSLWQAVVFGVAGLRQELDNPERLLVEPNLLPGMRRVSLPFMLRGRSLELHVCRSAVEVQVVDGNEPLDIDVISPHGVRQSVRAKPGQAYASKHVADGFSPWEEFTP